MLSIPRNQHPKGTAHCFAFPGVFGVFFFCNESWTHSLIHARQVLFCTMTAPGLLITIYDHWWFNGFWYNRCARPLTTVRPADQSESMIPCLRKSDYFQGRWTFYSSCLSGWTSGLSIDENGSKNKTNILGVGVHGCEDQHTSSRWLSIWSPTFYRRIGKKPEWETEDPRFQGLGLCWFPNAAPLGTGKENRL